MKRIATLWLFVISVSSFAQELTVEPTSNTSCGAPNGSASASVGGATAGYTFEWYEGANTSGTVLTTGATATGLVGGIYSVRATDQSNSQEVGTAQTTVLDAQVLPEVTVEPTPNTSASAPNGSATASVTGTASDYSFEWYDNAQNLLTTGAILSQVAAGTYTVHVTHLTTACETQVSTVIADEIVLELIVETIPNTSCSVANSNGVASASVGGATAGYTFEWYEGANTSGTVLTTGATATGLAAGVYSVRATDQSNSQEVGTAQTTVLDAQVMPEVTVESTPNTSASAPNGSATASVTGTASDYSFEWYDNAQNLLTTGAILSQVAAGTYTVHVTHLTTACETQASTVIADEIVWEVLVESTSNTSCNVANPNGSASATVSGITEGYTFDWYAGTDVSGSPFVTGATANGLVAGIYAVRATNQSTSQVVGTAQTTVVDAQVIPDVTVESTPNTSASTPNGVLTATVDGVEADYSFTWSNVAGVIGTGPVLSGLTSGIYSVTVAHLTTACATTVDGIVDDAIPVLATETINNTSCGTPNGTASATVDGATTGYTFEWRAGTDPDAPVLVTGPTATNLAAGIYSVRAINNNTSLAVDTKQVTILDEITIPEVTVDSTPNTSSTDANGTATATVTGLVADHSFAWYEGTSTEGSVIATSHELTGRAGGTYTVKVTNNNTACVATASTVIADEIVTAVDELGMAKALPFYPNPVRTRLFLMSRGNATVTLVDSRGMTVLIQSASASSDASSLDVSGVKPGVYLLRIREASKTTAYRVVIE